MIDFSDWEHGLEVLKESVAQGDIEQVKQCLLIMSLDIERFAKMPGINVDNFYNSTHIQDFYFLQMRGYGDYETVVRAVINDLGNLAQIKLDERIVKGKLATNKATVLRKITTEQRHDEWRKDAAQLREKNMNLSAKDIAERLSSVYQGTEFNAAERTIRRIVGKKI